MQNIILIWISICFFIQTHSNNILDFNENGDHLSESRMSDTLDLYGVDITIEPFLFGDHPMDSLELYTDAQINISLLENNNYSNEVDTLFEVIIANDSFEVYKSYKSWLTKAYVTSKLFVTKHGISVRMSKDDVKNKLMPIGKLEIPEVLCLKNFESIGTIFLNFSNDTLVSIFYDSEII